MTISLDWGELQCRIVADMLLKAGQSQADLATEFGTDTLVQGLVMECRDRAGFYKGLATDVIGCLADLREDERGEDDLAENCGDPGGSGHQALHDEARDSGELDA